MYKKEEKKEHTSKNEKKMTTNINNNNEESYCSLFLRMRYGIFVAEYFRAFKQL